MTKPEPDVRKSLLESEAGLFLAFEGVDGSGKSTQATLLARYLRENGNEVVHAREPGSTALGERIRQLVLEEAAVGVPPRSELFLMLAARAAFVQQVVRPALRQGRIVISDRFELSTLAYQGAGRGIPYDEVIACNRVATGGRSPDATILLDLPSAEGFRRQLAADKRPDRLEAEAQDFHDRVATGYRVLADRVEGLIRVDGTGEIHDVHRRVLDALTKRFPETFRPSGVIR
jgi:dTMP kinase